MENVKLPPCLTNEDRVVFFDGVCKFCAFWAKFIHSNDPSGVIKLGTLQSSSGQEVRAWCGLPGDELNTVIFVDRGVAYMKSSAVVRIVRYLRWPWPLFAVGWIVPWFIRDAVYDLVAKYRYWMFGKEENCMVPTAALKQRFLRDSD